jgi:hypothetical protein
MNTPPNAPLPSAPFTKPPVRDQHSPLKALLTNVRFTSWKRRLPVRFRSVAHASGVSYVGFCQNNGRRPNRRTCEISLHTRALCLCCGTYAANPPGTGDDRGRPPLALTGVRRASFVPVRARRNERETAARKHGRRFLSNIMISLSAIVPFGTGGRSNE